MPSNRAKVMNEFYEELHKAAEFDIDNDLTFYHLREKLKQRKHIAEQLLKYGDDERIKELFESYQIVNYYIKSLLGIL